MTDVALSQADDGRTVDARLGDRVQVRLPENPATGFRWGVEQSDPDRLALEADRHETAPGAGIGGGGQRVLVFRAAKAGDLELRLRLWRDWEGAASVSARFRATIRIRG